MAGAGLLNSSSALAQGPMASADTVRFPLRYCTALPRTGFEQWDADFERYTKWMTPEIRKTQVGLSFQREGVVTWVCRPSANPHAQLDTATAIRDAARLQGNWRAVSNRVVLHVDSASFADKRIYRTAALLPGGSPATLQVTDRKFAFTQVGAADGKPSKTQNSNYELVNQRYLLLYRLSKAAGAIQQVGLDPEGRLVLHSASVEERKIPGRYQVYQTIINQVIFERQ
ncbi:hypothetical protein GCM10027048_18320 [Hymenobacter coalescens]